MTMATRRPNFINHSSGQTDLTSAITGDIKEGGAQTLIALNAEKRQRSQKVRFRPGEIAEPPIGPPKYGMPHPHSPLRPLQLMRLNLVKRPVDTLNGISVREGPETALCRLFKIRNGFMKFTRTFPVISQIRKQITAGILQMRLHPLGADTMKRLPLMT